MTQSRTYNYEDGLRKYLSKAFSTVAIGVAISAVCAFIASKFLPALLMRSPFLALIMVAVELGIAIYFSARLNNMSTQTAWICYIAYSVVTGLTFSTLLLTYTTATITYAFIATAVMFACMAFIGNTTKVNYTKVYTLFLPAVLAGFIITLLNAFIFHSEWINMVIVYVGLVLFLVITAADVQKLKAFYMMGSGSNELMEKYMLLGAFQLYLDFVNLFLKILQIFGKKNSNKK